MKKPFLLCLLVAFALPALGQEADAAASGESGLAVAGMLIWLAECLLIIVGVLLVLAWIWFPFMVKKRLDRIIRKLEDIEQAQARLTGGPPRTS
jgi:hypothetical protein